MDSAQKSFDPVALENRMKGGASWFFWIAGLSVINSIMLLTNTNMKFVVGLGITDIATYLSKDQALTGKILALAVTAAIAGLFVFFGVKARGRKKWAFIFGMVIYGADALLLILGLDYLTIAFHVFALFFLVRGYIALKLLLKAAPASASEQAAG
jgi:hypothetical protein